MFHSYCYYKEHLNILLLTSWSSSITPKFSLLQVIIKTTMDLTHKTNKKYLKGEKKKAKCFKGLRAREITRQ